MRKKPKEGGEVKISKERKEWMCWCLEVNIQYPTLRVLHVWISLSEQGQGRYRTGQEGVEPKTGNRKIERDITGRETRVREVVFKNCGQLLCFCWHSYNSDITASFFLLFCINYKLIQHFVPRLNLMLAKKNLTFTIFWHRSGKMAVWCWQRNECWNIFTPHSLCFPWLWLAQSLCLANPLTQSAARKFVPKSGEQRTWLSCDRLKRGKNRHN